jgi:hypothetical protein
MSRAWTIPRAEGFSAACAVAAAPIQNATSMMESEVDFILVPP